VTLRELLGIWGRELGDSYFETVGNWQKLTARGSRGVTRTVARQLVDLLEQAT
jgi:hypothetical protein